MLCDMNWCIINSDMEKFEEELKKWSIEDLDVLTNTLKRDSRLSLDALQKLLPHKTEIEIHTLFKMMQKQFPSYSSFNGSRVEGPSEIPIEVCLQAVTSFCGEDMNYSSQLSQILYNIGNSYGVAATNEPDYRTIYHYLSALVSNQKPPTLHGLSAALVLELLFIVAGSVGGELDSSKPDESNQFFECEQHLCDKLGAFLLASQFKKSCKSLENFLSETFKLPEAKGDNEDKNRQSISKKVTLHSLNPLNIPKRLVDDMSKFISGKMSGDAEPCAAYKPNKPLMNDFRTPHRKRGRPSKRLPPLTRSTLPEESSLVPSFTVDSSSNMASGLSRTASLISVNSELDDTDSVSAVRLDPSSPVSVDSKSTFENESPVRSRKYIRLSDHSEDAKALHKINDSIKSRMKTYSVRKM